MKKTRPQALPSSLTPERIPHPGLAVVVACYNPELTGDLLRHTLLTLSDAGAHAPVVVRVPGSYEIPVAAMRLAGSHRFDAIIALGVVLQGKTAHADHIATACALHLQRIALETGVPVIHQILTPKNGRDARARLQLRGVEAARAGLEMAVVMKDLASLLKGTR